MVKKEFIIDSLAATENLAKQIAPHINNLDVVALKGNLGTGKTTFVQFLISSICNTNIEVLSPTFNLVGLYEYSGENIWHFDLYRLKDASELMEIGFWDAIDNGITIIEWPEIIYDHLPEEKLTIEFKIIENEKRSLTIWASGKWIDVINDF